MEIIKVIFYMVIYSLVGFYNLRLLKYKTNYYEKFNIFDKILWFSLWPIIWFIILIYVNIILIKAENVKERIKDE